MEEVPSIEKASREDDENGLASDTEPEAETHDELRTKNVEGRMIKSTNLILAISLIILNLLIITKVLKANGDFRLTKHFSEVSIFWANDYFMWI